MFALLLLRFKDC